MTVRRWLLVDADPVRDPHVSATETEKRTAHEIAQQIRADLAAQGWPAPILADSGNGYHLLYRVDLPGADGGTVRALSQGAGQQIRLGNCTHRPGSF